MSVGEISHERHMRWVIEVACGNPDAPFGCVIADRETGEVLAGPEIATRGFVHLREAGELIDATKAHVRDALGTYADGHETGDWGALARRIREAASAYLFRETRRRPVIVPLVMEV